MQITVEGSGPDLMLLHGWGASAHVWHDIAALLARKFRVHRMHLPFSGVDEIGTPYTLDTLADALAAVGKTGATICGWSLGGQVALRCAIKQPDKIRRLVLIAATPRFVRGANWEHGMEPAVFDAFAESLTEDVANTLQRFVLLQAHGDSAARGVARRLREYAATSVDIDAATLAAGLQILKETDLRSNLPTIALPVLILHGARDEVVPLAAGRYLQRALPHAKLEIIAGAAHAPFISNPQAVARHIMKFVDG